MKTFIHEDSTLKLDSLRCFQQMQLVKERSDLSRTSTTSRSARQLRSRLTEAVVRQATSELQPGLLHQHLLAWTAKMKQQKKELKNDGGMAVATEEHSSATLSSKSRSDYLELKLYRIYFFQSGRSRIADFADLEWQIWPEPNFQIDFNFTNLMCKTLRKYEWFEFLIIFCAAVTITSFTHTNAVIYAAAM